MMKRFFPILLLLLPSICQAQQQNFPGGGGITSVSVLPPTCTPQVTADVKLTVATPGFPMGNYTCGPAVNQWSFYAPNPSNAQTFTLKAYGLSPNDYGAYGDVKWCNDGAITNGQTTLTSQASNTISSISVTANVVTLVATANFPAGTYVSEPITVAGVTNSLYNGSFTILSWNGTTTITYAQTLSTTSSSGGTVTSNCAVFTAADVTVPAKVIDIVGAGAAGVTLHTTITAFISATQVTVGNSASTTVASLGRFLYGHDDTGPIITNASNWCGDIKKGTQKGTTLGFHGGWLGRQWYYITQPCIIQNPFQNNGFAAAGSGSPEPFTGAIAQEAVFITGSGGLSSGFVLAPGAAFNWNCPHTDTIAGNIGALYLGNWNGSVLTNFGIMADPTTAMNTSACNATPAGVGLLFSDQNGHEIYSGLQLEGGHNGSSPANLPALNMTNCFESTYQNIEMYNNDRSMYAGLGGTRCKYDMIQAEGFQGGSNVVFDNGTWNQTRITNSFIGGQGAVAIYCPVCDGVAGANELGFSGTFSTAGSSNAAGFDDFVVENTNIHSQTNNNVGMIVVTPSTSKFSFTNVHFDNSAAGASTNLVNNNSANATINIFGGSLECNAACANGIANVTGGTIYNYGAVNKGGNVSVSGTGAGSVFQWSPTATGWSGAGVIQGTSYLANQGTACTNGELALSAGWQSTGSATVTAAAGTGQTCSWTITTGTTTAANPTVTDTLTNALPTATTVCWMTVNGGTHTPVVGAGTSDAFRQTTLSATAPIFTYQETPTAGGTTYFVTRTCGP